MCFRNVTYSQRMWLVYDIETTVAPGGLKTCRVIDQAYHNFFLCEIFFWCSGRVSSWWSLNLICNRNFFLSNFSDVLEISAKSEGKRSHGTRDYPRTTGNSRHPSAQVTEKGHGHAATGHGHAIAGSLRTPDLGIKEDTWNQSGTHRLHTLGITYRSIFPKIRITY